MNCPSVTESNNGIPLAITSYEQQFLASYPRDPLNRSAAPDEIVGNPEPSDKQWATKLHRRKTELGRHAVASFLNFDPAVAWFWGGVGSSSYPLHRDLGDADSFFTVFTGCKVMHLACSFLSFLKKILTLLHSIPKRAPHHTAHTPSHHVLVCNLK